MINPEILKDLTGRYPKLKPLEGKIMEAAEIMIKCYRQGRKILICGNGGSCSDAGHIAGELMKSFEKKRPLKEQLVKDLISFGGEHGHYLSGKLQQGLPAVSLCSANALFTAIANDIGPDMVFAQQVVGLGVPGDVLIGLSTSGNSVNVVDALITARAMGISTIGMTGESGGMMKPLCDVMLNVPETRTLLVQELHLPVYHALCLMTENALFD